MTVGMGTVTETQPHPHCRGTRRGEKPTEPPKTEGAHRKRHTKPAGGATEKKKKGNIWIFKAKSVTLQTQPHDRPPCTTHHGHTPSLTPRKRQPDTQEATACHPPPINKDDMKAINLNNISPDDKYVKDNSAVPFIDNNLAIIEDIKDLRAHDNRLLIDGYMMLIVRSGHAVMNISGSDHEIQAHDIMICTPRNIIENAMFSLDFRVFGLFMSPRYGQMVSKEARLVRQDYDMSASHSVKHLGEKEYDVMSKYMDLLRHTISHRDSERRSTAINHIIIALTSEIYTIFSGDKEEDKPANTAAQLIFKQFFTLLRNESENITTVAEAANKLNISPKHFSAICKQVTGRTATDIISENIVANATLLLKNPERSVKEVALKLGFANQSHFGTFIKRHTGMSPQQLRKKL